jgi:competence protein ComGC
MPLENNNNQPPKKKSKALLIILILVGLFIITIPILGIFVAIAIPALAAGRQEAQVHIAKNIIQGTEVAIVRFETDNGRSPTSWDDIENYLKVGGQIANSQQKFLELARMPEGTKLSIRGINGAEATAINFPNGRRIGIEDVIKIPNQRE